jgi:hypothetical protein
LEARFSARGSTDESTARFLEVVYKSLEKVYVLLRGACAREAVAVAAGATVGAGAALHMLVVVFCGGEVV